MSWISLCIPKRLPSLLLSLVMVAMAQIAAQPVPKKKTVHPATTQQQTVRNYLGMLFVRIPAGIFTMGTNDRQPGEMLRPAHEVTLTTPFNMQTTEVTQAQWGQVMNTAPWRLCPYNVIDGESFPAVYMTWNEIQDFILKLNRMNVGYYRLPTEAEWEYACRAGTKTKYSFGNNEEDLDRYAWYNPGSQQFMDMQWQERGLYPHKVATKRPNPWGLFDMHGNVLEVCQSDYVPYPDGPVTDSVGSDRGSYKVIRGGSFQARSASCKSDFRGKYAPSIRSEIVGFRLVMDAEPGPSE